MGFESLSRNPPPSAVFEDRARHALSGETDTEPIKVPVGTAKALHGVHVEATWDTAFPEADCGVCDPEPAQVSPQVAWVGRILLAQIAVLIVGLLLCPRPAGASASVAGCTRLTGLDRRACIIRATFGTAGPKAVRVARCESGLDPKARNGQYRGVFQMGSSERATYGHGRTVLAQARAAKRYYDRAGWNPWECA